MSTLGELKKAIKDTNTVWVWCNWQGDDGDYIEVNKKKFLKSIGADTPYDGAHGGKHDNTQARFHVRDGEVFVC